MPIALNDVNVRGGYIIKPSHEKSAPVKSKQHFSRWNSHLSENYGYVIHAY